MRPKPIVIEQHNRKYFVFVEGTPVVKHDGKITFDRRAAGLKATVDPPPANLGPHPFTSKKAAEGVAHQIGRYILNRGDFVSSYTEYRKDSAEYYRGIRVMPEPQDEIVTKIETFVADLLK